MISVINELLLLLPYTNALQFATIQTRHNSIDPINKQQLYFRIIFELSFERVIKIENGFLTASYT